MKLREPMLSDYINTEPRPHCEGKYPLFLDPRDSNYLVCRDCEKKYLQAMEDLGIHPSDFKSKNRDASNISV